MHKMNDMFKGCTSLLSLPDISMWNTNEVKNIKEIFEGCISLLSLPDISLLEFEAVHFIDNITKDCFSLMYLPDISQWNSDSKPYFYYYNDFSCSTDHKAF